MNNDFPTTEEAKKELRTLQERLNILSFDNQIEYQEAQRIGQRIQYLKWLMSKGKVSDKEEKPKRGPSLKLVDGERE